MEAVTSRRSPWLLVPPPPLFVACFVLGVQLGRVAGIHVPDAAATVTRLVGALVMAAGAVLVISAPAMFAVHRTTIVPHGNARTLLTRGPYRITRNPMYLGLTLLYVGIGLATGHIATLVFLPLPVWVLASKTIPYEEATLERLFGDVYRAYAKRVRRWL